MKKILIATHNPAKVKTYRSFLKSLPIQLVSLKQLGITQDVHEDKPTFKGNAIKKALFFGKISGLPTIADDSGLEVDYLNGAPGIHSRRWGGKKRTDKQLVTMLLKKMKGVPRSKRRAGFTAVTSLYIPQTGRIFTRQGSQRGIITEQPSKVTENGYPYNQVFYLPRHHKTLSEIPSLHRSTVSHRNKNIINLIPTINKYIMNI